MNSLFITFCEFRLPNDGERAIFIGQNSFCCKKFRIFVPEYCQQRYQLLSTMHRKLFILSCLLCISCLITHAQEVEEAVRPVKNAIELKLGRGSARDTYLTPQLYSGLNLGAEYERWHAWKNPRWTSQQRLSAHFGMLEDKGHHSEEWVGRFGYRYAAHYRWDHLWLEPLTLLVGAFAGVEAGFDYNLKLAGGNNPATAKVAANMGLSAAGVWHYQLRGQACSAMLQLQLPLMGYALQPEYGASYYETFYLETAGHAHHFTSLHNRQDLDVRLTTDVAISAIPWMRHNGNSLRLGMGYRIETMDINQVVTRYSSFDFVIGLVFETLKYNRQKSDLLKRPAHEAY